MKEQEKERVIRPSRIEDLPEMLEIIDQAKAYFHSEGINQWQDGYPDTQIIKEDIQESHSHVMLIDEKIVGMVSLTYAEDDYFKTIDKKWLSNDHYGVIHRMAVSNQYKGQGVAHALHEYCEELAQENGKKSIRMDTHPVNTSMIRFLEKQGYIYCGLLKYDGDFRVAYEKQF